MDISGASERNGQRLERRYGAKGKEKCHNAAVHASQCLCLPLPSPSSADTGGDAWNQDGLEDDELQTNQLIEKMLEPTMAGFKNYMLYVLVSACKRVGVQDDRELDATGPREVPLASGVGEAERCHCE